ncbi:TonB-dependent receptor [Mangrovimonas spongiae]|uniref:TonB-dependent receptor n=1 Tax=Mangrovimonas spongiae TaxID=2494697 RepID=A0A428JZU5_9FLAO|nr:TonB-dependent receptor [Mangrovimonas spongiae]RSK39719.1 TonB-dependent receptor [Mangrovimonas spongiae]
MEKNKILLTLSLLFVTLLGYAQTGKVAGTIIDGEFVDPMPFANVIIKNTTKGTTSDFDGKYELELEAGTYTLIFSFVGYETKEISDVVIKANDVTVLDVTLTTNSLDEVVITTSVKRNTENAVLNMQRKSAVVMDGLSAQSIKKTGASNIASAVKSVPGVSVQGGKYVYVRGLGDRYTKSILNGVDIPGLDPDRNTIPMDIFPTNIIDNVIVLKSANADQPADFTGGIVDVITKDFPTKAEYSISAGFGYNPTMHFNDKFLTYDGSDTDFFGYDDGTRNRPINRYQPIPGTFENKVLLTSLTNRFQEQLKADKATSAPNFSLGLTAGNQYEVGKNGNKLGYLASASYKNNTTFYEDRIDGAAIKDADKSVYQPRYSLYSKGSEGINEVLVNTLVGLTFKTDLSKYRFTALHIQNGESSAGFFDQDLSQDNAGGAYEDVVKDALLYTERSITNFNLSGSHKLGANSGWDFDWTLSPSFSKVEDKDHRITPLVVTQENQYIIDPSTTTNPTRLWRNLLEESWVFKADFDKKYELFNRPAKFQVGGNYVYKFRDFSIDEFFMTSTNNIVPNGDTNLLLMDENLWTPESGEGTHLVATGNNQTFKPSNAYESEQMVYSTYISNEFNVSESLKAIVGLRTELYQLFYTGENAQGDEVYNRQSTIDNYDLFPSANLIYALNDNSNLRGSYSRTTARPSFKEASRVQIFDPITNRTFIGNGFGIEDANGDIIFDAVRPTYINNFDLRYELFRDKGQMIAFSGFYKDFKDPLEVTFFPTSAEQLTIANLGNATVVGAEVELRQNFGFLTNNLEKLRLNVNASYIYSELSMSDSEYDRRVLAARDGETIDRKRELQGQSPYLINAGFDYDNDDMGLQAGLFYNVQGESLEVVGTGQIPDVYTKPFHSLNFTFSKKLGENKKSSIDLKINNILGDERESLYDSYKASQELIYTQRKIGTEFSIGYSYSF